MTEVNSVPSRSGQAGRRVLLTQLFQYGVALLAVALALSVNLLFSSYLEPTPTPLFFAAVMFSAWCGGLGPGLLATALSTLAVNYLYVEPLYSLDIANPGHFVRLSVFVMAALLINSLNQDQRSAQHRAEANLKALRESEARFNRLAESGIIGTIVADLNGSIVDANDAFLHMVGYTREDLRSGRIHWREMTPPEYSDVSLRSQEELRTLGACTPFEKEYIRKDGSRVPILLGSAMLGESMVIGFVLDITERKHAEKALRQSEERLRVALKNSPITVFNQDRELRYTWIYNPVLDFRFTEAIGKQDQDFLSAEDASALTRIKRQVLETGIGLRQEVKLTLQEQDLYYDLTVEPLHDGDGATIGITCAAIDITSRKQMELALRQSETRLSALIASSPIGIALFDRDLRYVHANEALAATNGIPLNEHLGRTFWEVLPQWASVVAPILQRVMETKEPLLNQEIVGTTHPADVVRHGLVNYFPVCLPDGQVLGVGVTSMDITDRRRTEEALRASEERFQLIAQASNDVIWDCDLGTHKMWWSERIQVVLGYQPEELGVDMSGWVERVHPDDLERILASYETCLNSDATVWTDEYRFRHANGSYANILDRAFIIRDSVGKPVRVVGAMSDVTESKRVQQELQQTLQTLQTVVSAAPLPIVVIEPDLTVKLWNTAAEELFGWSEAELLGQPLPIVPEDKQEECRQLRQAITNGKVFFGIETYRRKRNGSNVILNISAAPFYDEHNNVNAILLILQDITERQQAEAEREQLLAREQAAREQAETANRIKDEFLAVLSHELRSPLNPILGWSKLLQTQKLDEQKTRQALATIERNAKLQVQLIEDLLDVSRILRGKLVLNTAPVDLVDTIEAALETVRLAVEAKELQIQKALNPNVGRVMGDAARLQQVIWNLLTNAVKFTPSGGTIEIRLSLATSYGPSKDKSQIIQNELLRTNEAQVINYAQIEVKDTGKGISPEFLPYVFDYFRQEDGTTTRKFGGLGLGLAIVRHITELHGGTVWAESLGEGLGSTFTVQLPLRPVSARLEQNQETPSATNLTGLRILAVDDDADIRELIEFILQQAGADVRVVASANEVLQQIEEFSPQVLISDIGMPEVDGYMLMQQVRSLPSGCGKTIPAIALTAYAGEIDQKQALAAGFQLHLPKPVEPKQLIAAIASINLA
jgi:PAS domain S-box-containing protein